MKESEKEFCVRVNYPCDYKELARVNWFTIIATSEEAAIKKCRKLAAESLRVEIQQPLR